MEALASSPAMGEALHSNSNSLKDNSSRQDSPAISSSLLSSNSNPTSSLKQSMAVLLGMDNNSMHPLMASSHKGRPDRQHRWEL